MDIFTFLQKVEMQRLNKSDMPSEEMTLRTVAIRNRKYARIWLYFDMEHSGADNGYWQFIHDAAKKDGVTRYYVTASESVVKMCPAEYKNSLVEWGTQFHKELLLGAEKVLTAFLGARTISPFTTEEDAKYRDLMKFETIYLQHGILHASHKQYAVDWNQFDRVVVSSHFEMKNFVGTYHYDEDNLIPTGMARYDHMDRSVAPKKRILLAPSWRSYFASLSADSGWNVSVNKFLKSNYYKNFMTFLNSDTLRALLEKYDMDLDVKLHPIAASLSEHFGELPERVRLADEVVNEEYSVFITDFSSFVFDFVYLERVIMYFVPDWDEFKCGMNAYRELDLPFEDAFGELSKTPEDAVKSLEKILKNDCVPEKIYAERMNGFFLPGDTHCERLYNVLMSEEATK